MAQTLYFYSCILSILVHDYIDSKRKCVLLICEKSTWVGSCFIHKVTACESLFKGDSLYSMISENTQLGHVHHQPLE